jgi:3'(2'), 5'-bisphosphate nucleotidase
MSIPIQFLEEFVQEEARVLRHAGRLALDLREKGLDISEKVADGKRSIVTNADTALDYYINRRTKAIYRRLAKKHGVKELFGMVSEEELQEVIQVATYLGQIDPIDGTKGYAEGRPNFVSQCSLYDCNQQKVLAAIIGKPLGFDQEKNKKRQEILRAVLGKGAFIDSLYDGTDKVHVSSLQVSERNDLQYARVVTNRNLLSDEARQVLERTVVDPLMHVGSTGNKFGMIAKGEAEAYLLPGIEPIYPWDINPGLLILEEAGGRVTDVYGQPIIFDRNTTVHTTGIVATNGKIHDDLLHEVGRVLQQKRD